MFNWSFNSIDNNIDDLCPSVRHEASRLGGSGNQPRHHHATDPGGPERRGEERGGRSVEGGGRMSDAGRIGKTW